MEPVRKRREWAERNPRGVDAIVAVFVLLFSLSALFGLDPTIEDRSVDALAVGLVVIPCIGVMYRRTHAIQALAVGSVFGFSYWILDYPNAGASFALLVLVYSVGRYVQNRVHSTRALIAFTVVLLLVLVTGYFYEGEEEVTVGVVILNVILFQLAWMAGDSVRNRVDSLAELAKRIEAAERDQIATTELAITDERNRIARELHDIMAHSLSVIVVQAEGAKRNVGLDDETVADALNTIQKTARENLKDLRGVVGMLRDDGQGRAPAPELSMVNSLIDQCGEAGLSVSLTINGEQRALPPMVELSGYRIVQESLTNTMKHAGPGAEAAVTLQYLTDALQIAVTDNGRGAAGDKTQPGHGLIGMRERVEGFGGKLQAGPKVGGGFSVDAKLPIARQ